MVEATASYVSTAEIVERESRFLARRQTSRPGFWRPFAKARLGALLLVLALGVGIVALGRADLPHVGRGLGLLLVAMVGLTAMDYWLTRRRLLRAHRVVGAARCPPGTVVTAHYALDEFTFGVTGQRVVLETSFLTRGVHEGRLLYLEQQDGDGWVVPDELLGPHGLEVVRAVLGDRLVER